MKRFTTEKQKIGEYGETLAQSFLVKQGFDLVEKNFNCRFGEVDLIMKQGSRLYFIEVKTVIQKSNNAMKNEDSLSLTKREQFLKEYRTIQNPFENISVTKRKKLMKSVEFYFLKHGKRLENFSIDGVGIILNENREVVSCKVIHNIIM